MIAREGKRGVWGEKKGHYILVILVFFLTAFFFLFIDKIGH